MIKKKDVFSIGDKIEIIREGKKKTSFFPSQVLDIAKDNHLIISGPIHKSNIIVLHMQEIIEIGYIIENRGLYVFDARIIDREFSPIYKLRVERVSKTKKYQKREFYRFETSIPVIKEQIIKSDNGEEAFIETCRTRDISGNGLQLLSNFEHHIGDRILCKFYIGDNAINVNSEIVRVEEIDTFDFKYAIGVKFLDIGERSRDVIIQYIFERERQLREKGLI